MKDIYQFKWEDLGDLSIGRPNLGKETTVIAYRLMQFTFKDALSGEIGKQKTMEIFSRAGKLAGKEFCRNVLDLSGSFNDFIASLEKEMIKYKIGVLRLEKSDMDNLEYLVTVSEDLDCSGLPVFDETVCDYDEGFLAGVFEEYTGREFSAKEIDCWATGDRTCRFEVKVIGS